MPSPEAGITLQQSSLVACEKQVAIEEGPQKKLPCVDIKEGKATPAATLDQGMRLLVVDPLGEFEVLRFQRDFTQTGGCLNHGSEALVPRDFARMDGAFEKNVFVGMVQDAIKVRQLVFVNGHRFSSLFLPCIISFMQVVQAVFLLQQRYNKVLLNPYAVKLQMLTDDLETARAMC